MEKELNRRAVTLALASALLATEGHGQKLRGKLATCADLSGQCDKDQPVDVPGPLLAYWLMRTTGNCLGADVLDPASAGGDNETVTLVMQCLGLKQGQFDFLEWVYKQNASTLDAAAKVWSDVLLASSKIKQFDGFSKFTSGYSGHACPKTAQILNIAQGT